MTKEMLWFLMGHLVCIGQWAAFIMVEYAFLGRGRRFRFPCLWAALLAAVFLAVSIWYDIGFFNVRSVILNVIYLLVTVLFFGGSWNQKLSACLVNGIMCLLTENTVSYTFAWCKHIPVREVWRYRSCLFLLVAAVVGAGHGFGLWNVRDVLKKYGGEYTISCRECWFRFTCTIPLRKL